MKKDELKEKETNKKDDVKKNEKLKSKKEEKISVKENSKIEKKDSKANKENTKSKNVVNKKEKNKRKEESKKDNKDEKMHKASNKGMDSKRAKIQFVATIIAIIIVLGLIAYVVNTIIQKQNFTSNNPIATIEVENYGTIKVELYPDYAPETVTNFIKLANNGLYDGLTFHRTIPDFMIQGGDPNGDGSGNATLKDLGQDSDEEYTIKGEFIANGNNDNILKHERGVISMARGDYSSYSSTLATEGYNSASCQFFITTTDQSANLDGLYAAFGKVTEGMEVVDAISNVEVETRESSSEEDSELTQDRPIEPPVIKSIRVETFGIDYKMPKTLEPFDINSWYMSQMYGTGY